MNGPVRLAWLAPAVAGACACLLAAPGCETSGGDVSNLQLSPSSLVLAASSATGVVFTAEGGTEPYVWTVSDPTLGTLAAAGGTAVYTSLAAGGTNVVSVADAADDSASAPVVQQ
jgi:hypothetical protein